MVKLPGAVTLNDCTEDCDPDMTLIPSYSRVSARAAPAGSAQAASANNGTAKNFNTFMVILSNSWHK
jgi:hypothetical protein